MSLGDRMKLHESAYKTTLPPRMPVILRLDGKAFHTYTRGVARPFDENVICVMNQTAIALCKEIDGAQLAYVQSDEISILVHTYLTFGQSPWFANEVQKLCSVTAGIASGVFTERSPAIFGEVRRACFDSRAFALPEHEVVNYFIWRQQDWTRNSVQMLARSLYSNRECFKKNNAALQDMCHAKGHNWNDLPTSLKRGRCVVKKDRRIATDENGEPVMRGRWEVENEIPIFTTDREFISRHLETKDEAA